MINYDLENLFRTDAHDKQLVITCENGNLDNEVVYQEEMTLTESLCSKANLTFGCCEASIFKIKIDNIAVSLMKQWLTVSIILDHNTDKPFLLGRYKVNKDKPSGDRRCRNILAYDALYDIINAEVAQWYNVLLPNPDSTCSLYEFRNNFMAHLGVEQEEVTLINDSMVVERTIEPARLSGKDVITAICEINGVFGHMGRNGKFQYISLVQGIQGLFPRDDLFPADDLFPKNNGLVKDIFKNQYQKTSVEYDDFITKEIDKVQIRNTEGDIGAIVGTGSNCYIVEDNFLVYGKSAHDLEIIAENLFSKIKGIQYRPFKSKSMVSDPCLEVGDAIRLSTNYEIIESYLLKRTIKGIQALRDTFEAKGKQYYAEEVNDVNTSLIQLKGKINTLKRTVEETKLTIEDLEQGLTSEIRQTADAITAEIKRAQDQEVELAAAISINVESIKAEVKRASEAEGALSSSIELTADAITAEVKRAQDQEVELAAAISINAEGIKSKVSKGDISSEISQEAGKVSIKANRFSLESDNTKISEDGVIECKNIKITGGSIQIETAYDTYDFITLRLMASSGNWTAVRETTLNPFGLECKDISGARTVSYSGSGIYSESKDTTCKLDIGMFNDLYPAEAGENITINGSTKITGSITVDSSLNVALGLSAGAVTIKPVGSTQYTLKKDSMKSLSSALGLSTKSISIPAGYMFSSNVVFTYNDTVKGYILTTLPTLVSVTQNSGHIFTNAVTFVDKNIVGY